MITQVAEEGVLSLLRQTWALLHSNKEEIIFSVKESQSSEAFSFFSESVGRRRSSRETWCEGKEGHLGRKWGGEGRSSREEVERGRKIVQWGGEGSV